MKTLTSQLIKIKGLLAPVLALLSLSACAAEPQTAPPADVPYTLSLTQLAGSDFPGLHSMIYVDTGEYVLLMAGRLNGMHGFAGQNGAFANPSFPKDKKNTTAFLIEKTTGKVAAKADVSALPSKVVQQLTATNTQFTLMGDVLYVVGGYGYSATSEAMMTLDQVLAVNINDLVTAVKNDKLDSAFAKQSIYLGTHPALAITGGELAQASSLGHSGRGFLLIFGHRFDGVYSTGGGTSQQQYSESVRKFAFNFGKSGQQTGQDYGAIDVEFIWQNPAISRTRPPEETEEYHRRDLTIRPSLTYDGQPQITAFGGVFKPGRMEGYLNPVHIAADDPSNSAGLPQTVSLTVDSDTEQLMGQYKAGSVSVYSEKEQAFYLSIFGGISQFYWKGGKLQRDTPNFNVSPAIDGLPFINTVSTLKQQKSSSGQYLHSQQTFPPAGAGIKCGAQTAKYLGAETVFVHASAPADNEAILLDKLSQPTVVGYLIGGIASTAPYPGKNTCAAAAYYQVTLTPGKATETVKLTLSGS